MMTRREVLKRTALLGAAATVRPLFTPSSAQAADTDGPFALPPLPCALDALEPHIDAQTMQIHHGKHHAAYVANLNKIVAVTPALAGKPVEELLKDLNALPEGARAVVRNHGGGHANHSFFWQLLKKNGGAKPTGGLAQAIDKKFNNFTGFQEKFTESATRQFGSGWAWLTMGQGKELFVESTPNQDTPLSAGRVPLLGIDVWEHAYYLKYQNRRPEYIAAFYNVIDWDFVADRFSKAV